MLGDIDRLRLGQPGQEFVVDSRRQRQALAIAEVENSALGPAFRRHRTIAAVDLEQPDVLQLLLHACN
ncbi:MULTISPECIES: hypothetical protein [unclassified Bradyrhizobium]|uniref:hypothetical protein n=1 Tax=unclassified Bradyrhizobium TaxID=2631580 RepID=UPI0028EC9BFC|nr:MULTISPECIES: hypothetical protein [unclassified Bradyrhizobium]